MYDNATIASGKLTIVFTYDCQFEVGAQSIRIKFKNSGESLYFSLSKQNIVGSFSLSFYYQT